jgi:hypothetical protein
MNKFIVYKSPPLLTNNGINGLTHTGLMSSGISKAGQQFWADEEGGELQLGELIQGLRRRRRLALATFMATLIAGALMTAWQRAYQPVYKGGFKLLVWDPINTDDRQSADAGGTIGAYAIQGSRATNTATFVEFLTSPLLLTPIERSLGLEEGELSGIQIGQARQARPRRGRSA